MGKTIDMLKQELREVREQRDRIRQTRDTLRAKLEATERQLKNLSEDYLDVWSRHVMPGFDTAIPSEGIVEHIAYRRDAEVCSDARMLREGWREERAGKPVQAARRSGFRRLARRIHFRRNLGKKYHRWQTINYYESSYWNFFVVHFSNKRICITQ